MEDLKVFLEEMRREMDRRFDDQQRQLNTLESLVLDLHAMIRTVAKQYGDLSLDVAVLRERIPKQ